MARWTTMALAAALLVSTPAAWARYQPHPCRNSFSEQQEMAEGKKVSAQVWQQMPVLPDANPVSRYVEALGMKLAQYAPGYRWPYNFHVVDSEEINAFALPGGSIFVNLGTIQAAATEAQLAGVMAHEISHVAQRHSTCNMTKQQTPSLLAGLGQIAAGIALPGAAGALAAQGIGMATGLSFLKMSREATDVIVNQVRGRSVTATNTGGAGGGAEHDWIVALPEPAGTLRYVIFVAPEADFQALRPTFEQMLRTLKLQ